VTLALLVVATEMAPITKLKPVTTTVVVAETLLQPVALAMTETQHLVLKQGMPAIGLYR
jgi:hypothetical protein